MSSVFANELERALADLEGLGASTPLLLAEHWELVKKWNARTNLTAVTDDVDSAWNHYRDSLSGLSRVSGRCVDIGSGAGFPGIPLAIARPDIHMTLLEPRRKRVSFLQAAIARLGLTNMSVIEGATTDIPPEEFDCATSRATFSSAEEMSTCLPWVKIGGPVILYRSEPTGNAGVETVPYSIRGRARVLEIWRRA